MNSEASRLETFDNWPSAAAVSPRKIAKAGFFYTKHNLTVECFSCHTQITEWNYGDQVMAKHKLLSPQCLFVLNPLASGNIPHLTEHPVTSLTPLDARLLSENYRDEANRLTTYTNWPKSDIVTPESLAKSGFYSLKWKDFTKCAFCDVVLVSWESGDEPDKEHKRCSPNCIFVKNVINKRLVEDTDNLSHLSNLHVVSSNNFQELGVQEHKAPKNAKCVTYESRLQTFSNWPGEVVQTPESLANAGFYYEGVGDRVRCFHCDGGLNHWDPQDEPWAQHAQWFPKCGFVLTIKGMDYVNSFSKPKVDEHLPTSLRKSPRNRRPITDSEVEEYLSTEPAIAALNIGLHVGRVKQAIKERLEETGLPYTNSDALIEATLNLQTEEETEDDSNQAENSRLSEGVSKVLTKALQRVFNDESNSRSSTSPSQENGKKQEDDSPMEEQPQAKLVESPSNLSLEEENRILKEARMCKICMDAEVGIVFLPCGHLTTCITCATNLQYCPLCRCTIKATVRTFLS